MTKTPAHPLDKLREKFPENQISKLPKTTKKQTEDVRADYKKGIRCTICGSWHHPDVVHLDYVGHAAATDRLLDTDIEWTWEPLAVDQRGLPAFDESGGLWIKLTVCGVTRLGYGSADGKTGGDAKKEIIGDAIRNSGMRFGMALDLWHKGDLHADDGDDSDKSPASGNVFISDEQRVELLALAAPKNITAGAICEIGKIPSIKEMPASMFSECKAWISKQPKRELGASPSDVLDDDIPYK
jgi:hypothetical protein